MGSIKLFLPHYCIFSGGNVPTRGAESEPETEPESPRVVAMSRKTESESESIKLPQLRLRNVLLESVI